MSRFRVAVVDDEPLARRIVRDLLASDPEVELAGEAGDGAAAVRLVREKRPDIVFLDVEMPERGGLDVAAEVASERGPAIVFVTAYGSYATRAFEVAALDYVVKPFSDERFTAALERAKERVRERRLSGLARQVAEAAGWLEGDTAASEDSADGYLTRIPIRTRDRTLVVRASEVVWIEAQDYYSRIHARKGSYLVRVPLSTFEEKLDPRRFLRIHRSSLVNLDEVVAVERLFKGVREVVLSSGDRCRVSRSRVAEVEERFGDLR